MIAISRCRAGESLYAGIKKDYSLKKTLRV
jgi:hypothetical protein